ncbi:MAG: hypothetical protein H0Z32_03760 [Bacillaceae bacterium]|nr:hypothetical protein [Bacillaceae bacterium]
MYSISGKPIIYRSRCIQLLARESYRNITIVEGPVGYGKTTLMAIWAKRLADEKKVVWLTLNEKDNNMNPFLEKLIEALPFPQENLRHQWLNELKQIEPSEDRLSFSLLDQIVQTLNVQGEIHLFFDQYEHIYEKDVHLLFEHLITYSGTNIHYYFASSAKLPFQNKKIQSDSLTITSDHLKYDLHEIKEYIALKIGCHLHDAELQKLYMLTEGWPLAVSHYVFLLDKSRAQPHDEYSAMDALRHGLHDLFLNQIFLKQSPALQQFMLNTSIPDFFDTQFSYVLSKDSQNNSYIEHLIQQNLFLMQEDSRNYRYHPLFAHFLQQRLKQFDREQFLNMHKQCSAWFHEHGFLIEAMQHALMIPDYELASTLFLKDIVHTFSHPNSKLLLSLEQFPRTEINRRPSIAMLYAWLLTVNQRLTAAETVLDQLEAHRSEENLVFEPTGEDLRGYIAAIKSRIYFQRRDTETGMAYMKEGKSRLNGQGYLFSYVNTFDKLESSLLKGSIGHWGAIDQAIYRCKVAEPLWKGVNKGYGLIQTLLGECYYERRVFDKAEKHLSAGRRIGFDLMETGLILPSTLTLVQLKWTNGEKRIAQILIEETRNLLTDEKSRFTWSIMDACQARIHMKTQQFQHVKNWMNLQSNQIDDMLDFRYFYEYLTLLRAYLYLRQFDQGIYYGERLLHYSLSLNLYYYIAEIHFLLSILYENQRQPSKADHHVREALEIGRQEGYFQLFLEEWEIAKSILVRNVKFLKPIKTTLHPEASEYYQQLLTCGSEHDYTHNKMLYAKSKLTPTEYKVFQFLIEGKSNAIIAAELSITIETAKTHCKNIYRKLHLKSRKEVFKLFND